MPKISIIVPVYRAEKTLEKCVESVLAQTCSDWELILVNDASPDGSGALCDALAQKDTRIRALHRAENAGVSTARNEGMDAACGEYIAFLDSDDWLEPEMYDRLYRALADAGADTAGCGHYNVLPTGERFPEACALPSGTYEKQSLRELLVAPLLRDRVGGRQPVINAYIWRYLFSKQVIEQAQLRFSGAYMEDDVFLIEYFCCAQRFAALDEPLYCYFFNPNSVTRTYLPDFSSVFLSTLEAKRDLVEKYKIEHLGGWEVNTCWAGLLAAVGNVFAPGNPAKKLDRRKQLDALVREPFFAAALQCSHPKGLDRNKQFVVDLLHLRMNGILAWLYETRNTRRKSS